MSMMSNEGCGVCVFSGGVWKWEREEREERKGNRGRMGGGGDALKGRLNY